MKEQKIIVWAMERLGIATAYGNRTQATDWLDRATPASCGFVAYNPFMPARIGWENYTIYVGGEDDMAKARILEGELTKWFKVRYEQYPRYSGNHVFMNVSVRARAHHIGMFGGGGQQEPDALNFTMPNGGTITLTKNGSPTTVTLEYTLDGGATWTEWTESGTTRTLTLNAGEKVYIRNTSTSSTGFSTSGSDYYQFAMTDTTEAAGNTNSLLCKNPSNVTSITTWGFGNLFNGCTTLTTAPELPATTLANYSYPYMFNGCTALTNAPVLPALHVPRACYFSMFEECTSLVNAPKLPAITMDIMAYYRMFFHCTNLETCQLIRVETVSATGCYQMFYTCYKLKYIKTYMTDISANNSLGVWLTGVSSTGDFYCDANLTIPTGASGIPTGWTRHDI